MTVREVDPRDKRELNGFIRLERELIGHHPLFVGELLDSDVRKRLAESFGGEGRVLYHCYDRNI